MPMGQRRIKEKDQETKMGLRQNLQTNEQMNIKSKLKDVDVIEQEMHVLAR